jgi:hypothetical protein
LRHATNELDTNYLKPKWGLQGDSK